MKKKITHWWQNAVGYQIYPLTFKDSNNDGYGDLKGIISKLDYLKDLGVNLLWITPFFSSPMFDNGYDVSNHYSVNSLFGTNDDFKELIKEVHKRDMHIIVDFVLNHTSDEHFWFRIAQNEVNSDERNFYIFKSPKYDQNGNMIPPNNWKSFFNSSCWEYDSISQMYYLHIFDKHMPDVDWENKLLREKYYMIAKTYLDLGVDGFRLDAISHLAKDTEYKDSSINIDDNGLAYDTSKFSNRPKLFKFLKEFKKEVFSKYDIVTIGEVGGCFPAKDSLKFVHPRKGSLNMVFNFDTCWENGAYMAEDKKDEEIITNVVSLKNNFMRWYNAVHKKAWLPIYWLNHDHPRVVSQYGSIKYRKESAKMLAATLLFLYGTPFIYNGEEIGMSNMKFESLDEINEIAAKGYIEERRGKVSDDIILRNLNRSSRIHARTVMQWSNTKNAGFTKGDTNLTVNKNYKRVNVKEQIDDPDSILNFYKTAIKLRKDKEIEKTILFGELQLIEQNNNDVFAYIHLDNNNPVVVISNFRDKDVEFNVPYVFTEILLHNYNDSQIDGNKITLRAFESYVFKIDPKSTKQRK